MPITDSGFTRCAKLIHAVPEPDLQETLFAHLVRVAAQKFAPSSTFGRRAADKLSPTRFAYMRKADALEAFLRECGAPQDAGAICKGLRAGGCPMPMDPKRDWQVISVVLKAHAGRFVVEGNRVGLREFTERVA